MKPRAVDKPVSWCSHMITCLADRLRRSPLFQGGEVPCEVHPDIRDGTGNLIASDTVGLRRPCGRPSNVNTRYLDTCTRAVLSAFLQLIRAWNHVACPCVYSTQSYSFESMSSLHVARLTKVRAQSFELLGYKYPPQSVRNSKAA